MRKWFALLVLLAILAAAVPVGAQEDLRLVSVSVDVWPEYDLPAVLVIYHLTLAPETNLPVSLTLQIPARAQLNAVAYVDPVNGLLLADYTRSVSGDWADLVITANSMQVQVEYYDVLDRDEDRRHIVLEWTGRYAVDLLEVNFLEPADSADLRIDPPPVETALGQDGLTNHRIQAVGLAAGQDTAINIDYTRSTDELHISSLPVEAVSTPGPDTSGRVSMTGVIPWVLAGLGVVLILAGIFGFFTWQSGRRSMASRKRRVRHQPSGDTGAYCPQCGKRAQPGDAFCRTCGSRLRREE